MRFTRCLGIGLLVLAGLPLLARAQTTPAEGRAGTCSKQWKDPVSGNWHDGSMWEPAGVPTSSDITCLDVTGGSNDYTVYLFEAPVTVNQLFVGVDGVTSPTITLDVSQDLETTSSAEIRGNGILSLTDCTFTVAEALYNTGAIRMDAAHIVGDVDHEGWLEWLNDSYIQGSFSTTAPCVITGDTDPNVTSSFLYFESGFSNSCEVRFSPQATRSVLVETGTLRNETDGSILAQASAGSSGVGRITAELDDLGLIQVAGMGLELTGGGHTHVIESSGYVRISDGGVFALVLAEAKNPPKIPSTMTLGGTIDIGTSSTLGISGGTLTSDGGLIEGKGTVDEWGGGDVVNGGTVSPGESPGILTFTNDIESSDSGVLLIELAGTDPGTGYDRLVLGGQYRLRGALDVFLDPPFTPADGDRFTIVQAEDVSGTFDVVHLPALSNGLVVSVEYHSQSIELVTSCQGADLGVSATADPNPVTVGNTVRLTALVTNAGPSTAPSVTLDDQWGPSFTFDGSSSSAQCNDVGSGAHCELGDIAPGSQVQVVISGSYSSPVTDDAHSFATASDICDPSAPNDGVTVLVTAVAAEACDADGDGDVDREDIPTTVHSIFGSAVAGNADCDGSGTVDATDLARLIARLGI